MKTRSIRDSAPIEAELVRRIAQGDREALGELYDLYAELLYSFATHALSDDREAEDVLQEVFLNIWEKAPSFNESLGSPFNWAVTMTRNRSLDRLRARRRNVQLFVEGCEREVVVVAENGFSPAIK